MVYVNELDSIFIGDKKYRNQLSSTEDKFRRDSKEIKLLWKTIQFKDSINLIKVKNILDKYGWLGYDIIRSQGNGASKTD